MASTSDHPTPSARALALCLVGASAVLAFWLSARAPSRSSSLAAGSTPADPATEEGLSSAGPHLIERDRSPDRGPAPAESASGETAGAARSGEAVLRIRIVGAEEQSPLAGLAAAIYPKQSAPPARGGRTRFSDADGWVQYEVPPNLGFFAALNPRAEQGRSTLYAPIPPLEPGERRELEFTLPRDRDRTWFGRVTTNESDRPVPRAQVELVLDDPFRGAAVASALSDADGLVELKVPSWRRGAIRVVVNGQPVSVFPLTTASRARPQALVVHAGASLAARVLDAQGQPLGGVTLSVRADIADLVEGWESQVFDPLDWHQCTRADGTCRIEELPSGVPLIIELRRGGDVLRRYPRALRLEPCETRPATWSLGTGCRVEGIAETPERAPEPGLTLWFLDADGVGTYLEPHQRAHVLRMVTTDAHGRFSLQDVGEGRWLIGPAAADRDPVLDSRDALPSFATLAEVIQVAPGQERCQVTLTIWRGLAIRGQVIDPSGAPVPGAIVTGGGGDHGVSTRSASDGSFALGPLGPGSYSCRASTPGGPFAHSEIALVAAGEQGVVLQLSRGAALSGRVFDHNGAPLSFGELFYSRANEPGMGVTSIRAGGNFSLAGLPPGRYTLFAQNGMAETALRKGVVLSAGDEIADLELMLEPSVALRIDVEQDARCRILVEGSQIAEAQAFAGKATHFALPSGDVEIQLAQRTRSGPEIVVARRTTVLRPPQETVVSFGTGDLHEIRSPQSTSE